MNETIKIALKIAYKIALITTVLNGNICLALNFFYKILFSFMKSIASNSNIASLHVQLAVTFLQQIFWVWVTTD